MKYCKQAIFEFTGNTSPVTSAQTQKSKKFTCNGAKSDFFRKLALFRHICGIFSLERTMKFVKNFQSSLAAYITQTQFTNFTTANKVVHQISTNKISSFSIKRQSSYQIPTDFHQKIILPYVQEIPHLPHLLPNFPPFSTFFSFDLTLLSRTFTIHRTAGERGTYFFNLPLLLSTVSQTLRN